ncbi:uncharacterized protein MONBRDRAFT_31053 [Monosiga brevicollis MX1]|uniref:DNA-directed RNA polymerases I, II, and III subunit RPABC1 n=1 Tax=Monosiga brevicollis TaxID=81824 RepID=A9UR01_MONBE|nr:uncharacterized protein MONBRDRAFT_31053 [Monosiga brevicollis MX1]EDQ92689.1 predicted protein [Monosiga brevicollis MX1]|eukprot:XP_001742451.1 hypothetical protein [Monosiga brevicollis MX1]
MDDEAERYRLYKVWITLKQMCHDRGFRVTQEMMNMTFDTWNEIYGEYPRKELSFPVQKVDDDNDGLFVFFPESPDVKVAAIKSLYDRLKSDNLRRAIIVYQRKVAPVAKSHIDILLKEDPPYIVETFAEAELVYNVTRHHLVPHHEILKESEKQQLLERYCVSEDRLPQIQPNDPVCRYFGAQKGQVLRIVRSSQTAGRYVTYRIVADIL